MSLNVVRFCAGSVPTEIGALTALAHVDFNNNQLIGAWAYERFAYHIFFTKIIVGAPWEASCHVHSVRLCAGSEALPSNNTIPNRIQSAITKHTDGANINPRRTSVRAKSSAPQPIRPTNEKQTRETRYVFLKQHATTAENGSASFEGKKKKEKKTTGQNERIKLVELCRRWCPASAVSAKIVMLSAGVVGKTLLLMSWVKHVYAHSVTPTIGAEFENKSVRINGVLLRLTVWDVGGCKIPQSVCRLK